MPFGRDPGGAGGRRTDGQKGADPSEEKEAGDLKAGTIMIAMDPTGPATQPCLIQSQGGKDTESWKAFLELAAS